MGRALNGVEGRRTRDRVAQGPPVERTSCFMTLTETLALRPRGSPARTRKEVAYWRVPDKFASAGTDFKMARVQALSPVAHKAVQQ